MANKISLPAALLQQLLPAVPFFRPPILLPPLSLLSPLLLILSAFPPLFPSAARRKGKKNKKRAPHARSPFSNMHP